MEYGYDVHNDIQATDEWLLTHHQTVESETGDKGPYHVFAMVTEPVFPPIVDGKAVVGRKDISIDIPILGLVTIQLRGWIDIMSAACDIKAYAKVPILPVILLGRFQGNLKDGIKIEFGNKFISGWLRLYAKDGWLRAEFGLKVFGKSVSGDIKLIPLPFGA